MEKKELLILLGAGATGLAIGYLAKKKAGAAVSPAALQAVPIEGQISPGEITVKVPPLTVSYDPLEAEVYRTDWPPHLAALYYLKEFLRTYCDYVEHRQAYAMERLESIAMRLQGSEYAQLTRADLFVDRDLLAKAIRAYTWEYGVPPWGWESLSHNYTIASHFISFQGQTIPMPDYAASPSAQIGSIVSNLLYELKSGKIHPCPAIKALILPNYTVAQTLQFIFTAPGYEHWTRTYELGKTYNWVKWWEDRGFKVSHCGTKTKSGYVWMGPPYIAKVDRYCVQP